MTITPIEHARELHRKARAAHREEARQRREAKRYMAELEKFCREHRIEIEYVTKSEEDKVDGIESRAS